MELVAYFLQIKGVILFRHCNFSGYRADKLIYRQNRTYHLTKSLYFYPIICLTHRKLNSKQNLRQQKKPKRNVNKQKNKKIRIVKNKKKHLPIEKLIGRCCFNCSNKRERLNCHDCLNDWHPN